MRKFSERKLTVDVERKAWQLAKTILPYSIEDASFYRNILLKVCRKCVIDGFPLQDYYLGEVPYSNGEGIFVYFVNKLEDSTEEIAFWCLKNDKIAVPQALCDRFRYEDRRNCFDAVYEWGHFQKLRYPTIRDVRGLIHYRPYKRYFENIISKPRIKILAIADLHDWSKSELELINDLEYDCCCLLGDIPEAALEIIKQLVHKPLYGVLGNHDDLNTLSRCGIKDLNGKSVTVNGVKIAGFGGSHRYKNGDYPMLTQKESIKAAAACPAADILISHDAAYHVMKQLDSAHCGLKGISRYITRSKTGLNICGHYHISDHKRLLYKGCDIMCVYKCAIVSFPENSAEIIF